MVTAVFLSALLVTGLYHFSLIPGVRRSQPKLADLVTISVVLFAAAAVSWITAFVLASDDI